MFDTGGMFVELRRRITNAALLEGVVEFADLEARCRERREYQTLIIPGLLQTDEYAEALARASVERGSITQARADESLEFLADRQRRFWGRTNLLLVRTVMEEACIRRQVGGPAVMGRQLDHLADIAKRPNVTIQVAPLSLGELVPFKFPTTLLTMANRSLIGYTETHQRGYVERTQGICLAWARDYDHLVAESHGAATSLAKIREAPKGLE